MTAVDISLSAIFPVSARVLPEDFWQTIAESASPATVPERIAEHVAQHGAPAYLPDLAWTELARHRMQNLDLAEEPGALEDYQVNPQLILLPVAWRSLLALLAGEEVTPQPGNELLLFWRAPRTGEYREAVASAAELLALKVVAEQLDPLVVAKASRRPVGVIDAAVDAAVEKGLLQAPASALQRSATEFPARQPIPDAYRVAEVFTLQWHITHRCDLHCHHCYDRSRRDDVDLASGLDILDQLRAFCRSHHVRGQVSFSGGNPFLHPDFVELYRGAVDRNLTPAILGNPVSAAELDKILQIAKPVFFQVSLEGLPEHNDRIRGQGSFAAVMDFLCLLRSRQIYSMVMLTLTKANLDQVLPLAELLRDRVDLFTFNRLAMVGEGARLASVEPAAYQAFLGEYLKARHSNPVLALKDSLLNIGLEADGLDLFGGCTGYGCGAAFNFVSLLPDGEVHACRKFPSLIGNLREHSLDEIYHSEIARDYRKGCRACDDCRLRSVCGGCLAVSYGYGLDSFKERDPACFIES